MQRCGSCKQRGAVTDDGHAWERVHGEVDLLLVLLLLLHHLPIGVRSLVASLIPFLHSSSVLLFQCFVFCCWCGAVMQVVFDPLDGSSVVGANFAVGTIFGVWPGHGVSGEAYAT